MDMTRISTCSYPLREKDLDYTFDVIAAAGFQKVDLWGGMPHFSTDPEQLAPEDIEALCAKYGVKIKGVSEDFAELPIEGYSDMLREVASLYPNLKLIASTLRSVHSATRNAWGAIALYEDKIVHVPQTDIEILDRVGGGDSFASGLIYGLLAGNGIDYAVRCGVAHGALAMTTPGDTSMATLSEVERIIKGGSARIAR